MARSGKKKHTAPGGFERVARLISQFTGSTASFLIATLVVLTWAATGPVFHYSSNWQLVINTGTTIVTFLMVFLIQRTQNKDSLAVQLKLNEIVAALEGASNRLVNVEDLSEEELSTLHRHYQALAEMARRTSTCASPTRWTRRRRGTAPRHATVGRRAGSDPRSRSWRRRRASTSLQFVELTDCPLGSCTTPEPRQLPQPARSRRSRRLRAGWAHPLQKQMASVCRRRRRGPRAPRRFSGSLVVRAGKGEAQ